MIITRIARAAAAVGAALLAVSFVPAPPARAAVALGPVNPVRVDLDGHPANSGFLAFIEGDVALNADESEGTLALGGDLSFGTTYNISAGATPADSTFTAPGDSLPTFLYVGGGMQWAGSSILRVLNNGFTKVADTATYSAYNVDSNGAASNYRITQPAAGFEASPHIEGTTNQQTPASIGTPVPSSLIDIPGAFALYRELTTQLGGCEANAFLTNPDTGAPLPEPVPAGTRGRLELTAGQTNVLNLTAADFANLSEITFGSSPTDQTPLIVNVIGSAFAGNIPNQAGISGSQAPYMLWNFPQASSIEVTGGATIEGTLYAPNAALHWQPTQNIEGNVIAKSFVHGPTTLSTTPRELHDFPFATNVSCDAADPTGTLTLVKNVVNTGGGTAVPGDWTLTATGPSTVTGDGNSEEVTEVPVDAGDYELTESGGPAEYQEGTWTCSGAAMDGPAVVTVPDGGDVVCEITNTFVPPTVPPSPPITETPTAPTSPTSSPSPTSSESPTTSAIVTAPSTFSTTSTFSSIATVTTTTTFAADGGSGGQGGLADTGVSVLPPLLLGGGLVVVGITLIVAVGRRRRGVH